MHIVSTLQYERMKQISEIEGKLFMSSIITCKKGWSMHRKKKAHEFPISSRDVTNQTPPGQE